MAEALAAVGAAASFVQLTDVSIRTCLYLYSFFSSLHKAQDEFQRHIIVLRDVHDAIQLVRQTTANQTFPTTEDAAMRKHLLSITRQLSTLEKVTAGKNPAKLSVRLKWVMKSAETDRTLQELERRKTSLILLLQTITLRRSAQSYERQETNQAMLKSLTTLVEQQSQQDVPTNPEISARFDRLSIEMDSNLRMYKDSLDESFSTLTRNREVTIPEECVEQALRRVLDGYILPRVEESFSKTYQLQNAATLRHVQEAMSQAAEQILRQVANTGKTKSHIGSRPLCNDSNSERVIRKPNERSRAGNNLQSSPYVPSSGNNQITPYLEEIPDHKKILVPRFRPHRVRKWSYWTFIPAVGTLRIEYGSLHGSGGRFWTIQIDFWPSFTLLLRKSISLKYNNNYDIQGYVDLSPSLAIYPIISDDHPIWDMISTGDLDGVRVQLQDHKNGLYDQDSRGISLLMSACIVGRLDVAQFLLTHGADPTRSTAWGCDSLHLLLFFIIYRLIYRPTKHPGVPWSPETDFPFFSSLFHDLIASGCNLDDCDGILTIFPFLEDAAFADMYLNQEVIGPVMLRDGDNDSTEARPGESVETQREGVPLPPSDSAKLPVPLDEDCYLAEIRQLVQFLRRQGLDLVQDTSHEMVFKLLETPKRMTLSVLRECGLDINYRRTALDCMGSLLYHCLVDLQEYPSTIAMNNLIYWISSGADIYDIEVVDEFRIFCADNDGLISPTLVAEAADLLPFWRNALREAGYDPEEVFLEDNRRRREFRRLHGANCSAVEVEEPPSSTLRRRLV